MTYSRNLEPGRDIGPFTVKRLLGRGAFKTVYMAANRRHGENGYPETVALCVPHAQDAEAVKLLEHEFRMVRTFDHPSIVKVYGLEEEDGAVFMVMELAEGRPLNEILKEKGALPVQQAVEVIRRAGEAIDYAHEGLAIHRDIKPANIMVAEDGGVKVLDFGLARLMVHSQYKASTRVGSVAYMAPEQFEGAAGMNADLWSLGLTFFQLITNTLPFLARDEANLVKQILYDPPDLDPIEHGGFDLRLAGVMRKVLEKDPDKRYRRAAEFIADLEAVLRRAATVSRLEGSIEACLRAHFPLVILHTHEEARALESLGRIRRAMSAEKEVGLYTWSETRGLVDEKGEPLSVRTLGDPLLALEYVIQSDKEGIYVFLDIHRHFTPVAVRLVRDAIWTVKRKRKSLVFISPVLDLPRELQADATLFFYDLPDMEDLKTLVDELAAGSANGAGAQVDGALREGLARAVLGLTHREAWRVLYRSILRNGSINHGCVQEALSQKQQIVRKAGMLEYCRRTVDFTQVGGLDRLKLWFRKRRQAFTASGARFGLRAPRGVVLVGVPGCGKSLSAKALASEWDVPLLRLDFGRIYSSLLGASENNLRNALHIASAVSPCVLWIDELEKAFGGLGQSHDSGVSQRIFGTFLTWLEERQAPVFVVATANDISRLPPEFTRKGRFDDLFFVGLPGEKEREDIFRVHIRKRRRNAEDFDMNRLIEKSPGFSGAEIEEAVISGLYKAFDENERPLETDDIVASLAEIVPVSKSRAADMQRLYQWAAVNAQAA